MTETPAVPTAEPTETPVDALEEILDLTSPENIVHALIGLGYADAQAIEDLVTMTIGGKFPVLLQSRENELKITCELCELSGISEEKMPLVLLAALEANPLDSIAPFAFGIVPNDDPDTEEEEATLVLVDSIHNDFATVATLDSKMQELLEAITSSSTRDVLEIAYGEDSETPE